MFTLTEKDPRRRIILAPYVFYIQFTYKKLYLSIALGSPSPGGRKNISKLRELKNLGPWKLVKNFRINILSEYSSYQTLT